MMRKILVFSSLIFSYLALAQSPCNCTAGSSGFDPCSALKVSIGSNCSDYPEEFRTNGCFGTSPASTSCGVGGTHMVWATFQVATSGTFNINWTASNSRNIRLGLYTFSDPCDNDFDGDYGETEVSCVNGGGNGVNETLTQFLTPGTYYVAGESSGNLSAASQLCVYTATAQVLGSGDCGGFVDVCTDLSFQVSPNGVGSIVEAPTCAIGGTSNPNFGFGSNPWGWNSVGCLQSGEKASTWMRINVTTAGNLAFTFGGGGTQTGFYDWSMWEYSPTACTDIINDNLAPVRCNWNAIDNGGTGLETQANLTAAGLNATQQENYEPPLAVGSNTQYIICFSNYSDVTTDVPLDFTNSSAGISCTPLPIELFSLQANNYEESVVLSWLTPNSNSVSNYIIERAGENGSFIEVGDVQAENINPLNSYYFTDDNALFGQNYYRIRAISENGGELLTNPVSIFKGSKNVQIYPNPTSEQLNVEYNFSVGEELNIYDLFGRKVYGAEIQNPIGNIQIDCSGFEKGIYLVELNKKDKTKELIKLEIH